MQLAKKLDVAVVTLRDREHNRDQTDPDLQALLRVLDKLPEPALRALNARRDGCDERTTPRGLGTTPIISITGTAVGITSTPGSIAGELRLRLAARVQKG